MIISVSKPMLEKHQVAIYFRAVFAGLLAATFLDQSSAALKESFTVEPIRLSTKEH
ncbi:hypothetical protein [Methyloglobulus sp.]|uniref:hypothetical protein n=1 Tax=Methyloglobulus sp. TaxID=2518622 RepID=UPI003988E729